MEGKKLKYLIISFLIVLLCYLLTFSFSLTSLYSRINNSFFDSMFRITKNGDVKTNAVGIIAINDNDLTTMEDHFLYSWPWPRMVYGLISDYLIKNGAKAVVFDIVFSNPDFDRERLGFTGKTSDYYFRRSIIGTGKVVVPFNIDKFQNRTLPDIIFQDILADIYNSAGDYERDLIKEAYSFDDESEVFTLNLSFAVGDIEKRSELSSLIYNSPHFYMHSPLLDHYTDLNIPEYDYIRFPYSLFSQGHANMGFVENFTDYDGIIRQYQPIVKVGDRVIPSLALSAYLTAEGKRPSDIPLSKDGNFTLKWYGTGGIGFDRDKNSYKKHTFDYYSFYYIFDNAREEILMKRTGNIPAKEIKDRVFFIGNISRALLDEKNTPFSAGRAVYPGVEIHATAYINLLYNDFMKRPAFFYEMLAYVILIFIVTGFGVKAQSIKINVLFSAFIMSLVLFLHFVMFQKLDYISNSTFFIILTVLSVISTLSLNYFMVGRNRNLIKNALGTYISPALEKEITASGKPLSITGESVTATAMFIDIAGFTTFSENNPAAKVVEILNIYLHNFSEYIMDNSGFVNKFLGDGLMALFGTITPLENHVDLALDSAIKCLEKTLELAPQYGLDIRIGINSGEMIKGNMGGAKRLEFTAIGDNVNLASRLEGANKFFGTKIILGENSYDNLKNKDNTIFLGKFCVKGKAIPIRFYAYCDCENDEKNRFSEFLDVYYSCNREKFEKMIPYYRENKFKPADVYIEHFFSNPDEFGMPIKFTEK